MAKMICPILKAATIIKPDDQHWVVPRDECLKSECVWYPACTTIATIAFHINKAERIRELYKKIFGEEEGKQNGRS